MLNNIVGLLAAAPSLNSYESIATASVGAGATSATLGFTSIPSTYKHLQIRGIGRITSTGGDSYLTLTVNGDTGSNYTYHDLYGNGSTATASGLASQTATYVQRFPFDDALASTYGSIVMDILDYTSTNKNKTIRTLGGVDVNGSGGDIYLTSGAWLNSSTAITSLTFTPSANLFKQYSSFALYGIKG